MIPRILVLASFPLFLLGADPAPTDLRPVLDAIRFVEGGHRKDCPDGDGGRAIGPYQIHYVYWYEAVTSDPSIGGSYEDCRKRPYAEKVIRAYMRRHVPKAWEAADAETIARTHNGGPRGSRLQATLPYWEKVKEVLDRRD